MDEDLQIAAALAELAGQEPAVAEGHRAALEWGAGGAGPGAIPQEGIQVFCWYELPVKWFVDLGWDLPGLPRTEDDLARYPTPRSRRPWGRRSPKRDSGTAGPVSRPTNIRSAGPFARRATCAGSLACCPSAVTGTTAATGSPAPARRPPSPPCRPGPPAPERSRGPARARSKRALPRLLSRNVPGTVPP